MLLRLTRKFVYSNQTLFSPVVFALHMFMNETDLMI